MSEPSQQKQTPLILWIMVMVALVLSIAAIMLHITRLLDQMETESPRSSPAYVQNLQNQLVQMRIELNKLQADMAKKDGTTN
jgi:flagellar basal body-associated protein FliL